MKKILLLLILSVILISCGKKEIKQISQESKITQEAFALTETIKKAFILKDNITLQKNSTEAGYIDITTNTKKYDSVEFIFIPRWVNIENDQLHVNISWKSSWVVSGRSKEDSGMTVFLMEGSPLKVSKILRGNPFIYPEQ